MLTVVKARRRLRCIAARARARSGDSVVREAVPAFPADVVSDLWRLAVALAVGLVIGGEREQRKGDGPRRAPAGIRTFALVGLLGGVAALAGPALVATCAVFVGAAALAGYALGDRSDPGLTTEVALLLTYALGAIAVTRPAVAFAAGVCAALLLAARATLHTFLRSTLTERELRDALVLGVCALVLLPLLPDRFVGPWRVINPQLLWKLAVVSMAITAAGYVAQRALGAALGLAFSGLAGGFVSSAATVAAMGARGKEDASLHAAAVAGATASTVATFVQLAIVVWLADAALLPAVAWPLAGGGAAAVAYSGLHVWRATRSASPVLPAGRAFSIPSSLLFAALLGAASLLSAMAAERLGPAGVPAVAGLAGLADAHAAAASAATLHAAGGASTSVATLAVLTALTTNAVTKAVLAYTSGTRRFAADVGAGQFLVVATAWAVLAILRVT